MPWLKDLFAQRPRKVELSQSFGKYVEQNGPMLTGLGVIATVAAIFLNIDPSHFDGIKSLQLPLLLFLILSLIFVLINTSGWLIENTDSAFSSIIIVTLMLFIYQLCIFVVHNFGAELKHYLSFISLAVLLSIWTVLKGVQRNSELHANRFEQRHKEMLHGAAGALFIYAWIVSTDAFQQFSNNLTLTWTILLKPLLNPIVCSFLLWTIVIGFAYSYGDNMNKNPRIWRTILFTPTIFFLAWGCMELIFVTSGLGF
jgi:hypothetical protein